MQSDSGEKTLTTVRNSRSHTTGMNSIMLPTTRKTSFILTTREAAIIPSNPVKQKKIRMFAYMLDM